VRDDAGLIGNDDFSRDGETATDRVREARRERAGECHFHSELLSGEKKWPALLPVGGRMHYAVAPAILNYVQDKAKTLPSRRLASPRFPNQVTLI